MSQVIAYEEFVEGITLVSQDDLTGFFVDWPERPSPSVLLLTLSGSHCSFMARSPEGRVVGIVSAISDGVLSAHVSLLEVLPQYQGRGIGSQLIRLIMDRLEDLYMVDLCCDAELVPFYRGFGMAELGAMGVRRPDHIPSG